MQSAAAAAAVIRENDPKTDGTASAPPRKGRGNRVKTASDAILRGVRRASLSAGMLPHLPAIPKQPKLMLLDMLQAHNRDPEEILPHQLLVKKTYDSRPAQIFVAVLIFANFVLNVVEAQHVGNTKDHPDIDIFVATDNTFTTLFTIELVINLYGSWFWYFWTGPTYGWNIFDALVVLSGLVALQGSFPGFTVLRLIRAFRIVRLFRHVESLRSIVEGVVTAMPGVSQAFAILFIFMGIWSVIGVEFYRNAGASGEEIYGDFTKGMFTTFQMLTGDSWCEDVTRRLVYDENKPSAAIVHITYLFISGTVLSNVVVAILLERYLNCVKRQKMRRLRAKVKKEHDEKVARLEEARKAEMQLLLEKEKIPEEPGNQFEKMADVAGDAKDKVVKKFKIFHGHFYSKFENFVSQPLPAQKRVRVYYDTSTVQLFVGALILGNFLFMAIEKCILPSKGDPEYDLFLSMEVIFNVAFTVELVINLYGNWFWYFWEGDNGGWNAFDVLVVLTSWLSLGLDNIPGVTVFRLFRAFRIIRLFKRVDSLRTIIESILLVIPKVLHAFAILVLLTSVWAIMGVQFFGTASPQRFKRFSNAFLSMWQTLTEDSWASGDGMARYLMYEREELSPAAVAMFFCTYIFVGSIIMTNVVITILLEGYLSCSDATKERRKREKRDRESKDGEDHVDRYHRMRKIKAKRDNLRLFFESLDHDGDGTLTVGELAKGLEIDNDHALKLLHQGDDDADGLMTLEEFLELIERNPDLDPTKAEDEEFKDQPTEADPDEVRFDKTDEELEQEILESENAHEQEDKPDPYKQDMDVIVKTLQNIDVRANIEEATVSNMLRVLCSQTYTKHSMEVLLNRAIGGEDTGTLLGRLRGDPDTLLGTPFPGGVTKSRMQRSVSRSLSRRSSAKDNSKSAKDAGL